MNGNAREFLSTGCQILSASGWERARWSLGRGIVPELPSLPRPWGLWELVGDWHKMLVHSVQCSGSGFKHCPCVSLLCLVETSGLGVRFTPGRGAAGVAVSRCYQSAQPPRWKFLCLHFKANCNAWTPSATLTFMCRMHVLAHTVLIPWDDSQTFVECLLPLLHGSLHLTNYLLGSQSSRRVEE